MADGDVAGAIREQLERFPELIDRIRPLAEEMQEILANAVAGKDRLLRERVYRDVGRQQKSYLGESSCPLEKSLVQNLTYCELATQSALRRMVKSGGDPGSAKCFAQVYAQCQKAYLKAVQNLEEFRCRRALVAGLAARGEARLKAKRVPRITRVDVSPGPAEIPTAPAGADANGERGPIPRDDAETERSRP